MVVCKQEDLKYWFKRDPKTLELVSATTGLSVTDDHELLSEDEIKDFRLFKEARPEYIVGTIVDTANSDIHETYIKLLTGAFLLRYCTDTDKDLGLKYAQKCIEWLDSTDFFRAPASTKYHEAFASGLALHSLKVYNEMIKLKGSSRFKDIDIVSATICALTHDWCKIGMYEPYNRNVKNEQTGQWEQKQEFRHNAKGVPLGHGTSSMFLASRFFVLSPEEACAIRWHMGAWYVADSEMNDLQRANETYPMVHFLQFADQLAIVSY